MKFPTAAVFAVLAAIAEAKVQFTNSNYDITEGDPFTLKWSGAEGPVTITVKSGPETNLKDVMVIDSADSGTSFTWTPKGLPSGTYAFEIKDSTGVPNYSPQFTYQGTGTLSSTAGSSSASKTSTSASSSSSVSSTITSSSSSSSASSTSSSSSSSRSSSSSSSSSKTSSSTSSTSTPTNTSRPSNTNDSQNLKSPLALLLLTVGALVFFH
ncbi:uncharacterized protein E0L32_003667 [Thyridium curvatum]|uniref:Extracellular matrix protein n=1 Tax=Thyridium curvatum TaxID=1093900 RepID=A0A507BBW9_9PEZI|nr:uncharacterized protein E0L32_003667 [Thyridium curvatum]TPX16726.1 hypothetical protein E0L32_003667 [Thyridium curvatum]